MALSVGFARYDAADTDSSVWSEVLDGAIESFFRARDYGIGVQNVVFVWTVFVGSSTRTVNRSGLLTIPVELAADCVRVNIGAQKRLDYLIDRTLEQVSKDSQKLTRSGFDGARFLADLTVFFRTELPRAIAADETELEPNYDKL